MRNLGGQNGVIQAGIYTLNTCEVLIFLNDQKEFRHQTFYTGLFLFFFLDWIVVSGKYKIITRISLFT